MSFHDREKVEGALEGLAVIVDYLAKHVDEGIALHRAIEANRQLAVNPVWEPLRYNDPNSETGAGIGWAYAHDSINEAIHVVRTMPWGGNGARS